RDNAAAFAVAGEIGNEYCLRVTGTIRPRVSVNDKLKTGTVELVADAVEVLNAAKDLPFAMHENPNEDLRMTYRYLDLRRPEMQAMMRKRIKLVQALRRYLDARGFQDIETPILTKPTPEGARDYLVPSRVHAGEFYALPQSPQIYKQLLMVSGFDRYFQIARCFRDEDLRADRQPEFTQIDVEMSFATQEDVLELMESAMRYVWKRVLDVDLPPFPRLTHARALAAYGSDKPDLRFGLELADVGDLFAQTEFVVFKSVLETGGAIVALRYPGGAALSRRDFDALTELAKTAGAKGMVWIAYGTDGIKSSAAKFLNDELVEKIAASAAAERGDAILLFADARDLTLDVAGRMRNEVGERCGLRDPNRYAFAWVTDFPLFEMDEETGSPAPAHHPFTAPGEGEWELLESEPMKMRAQHYDMVLNGFELGSGSIRIHKPEFQRKIFAMLGLSDEAVEDRFGFFVRALDYGAPPHGGMALGIDRIVMLAVGETNIRDVIAFPKNQLARDVMMDAPTPVPERLLRDLALRSTAPPRDLAAAADTKE
ncbi:MAG TPA: aspartate--tRNA ligase, partial [Candidatus Baltobacteraceae bacterium]